MSKIWFTSDTHGYHKNITRGVTDWCDASRGCRDFDTIDQMTDAIVDGINKHVLPGDVLFHLGDWTFGGQDKIKLFRDRILCENIHLITGNHDLHIINKKHHQVHFKEVVQAKLITIDKTIVYMSHFPCEDARFDKKSVHIHGHCHGARNEDNLDKNRLDVGIDSAYLMFGEYRPFDWDDIKKYFNRIRR